MTPERAIAYRKQAGALLEGVLDEILSPRTALNCWPYLGNEDPSVRSGYAMLWFYEADEDRHKIEPYYADMQLKTLREASGLLMQGLPLTAVLLQTYQGVRAPVEYHDAWTWREPTWWVRQQVKRMVDILRSHPKLQKTTRSRF